MEKGGLSWPAGPTMWTLRFTTAYRSLEGVFDDVSVEKAEKAEKAGYDNTEG